MGSWIDRRRRLRLARFAKGFCPGCGDGRPSLSRVELQGLPATGSTSADASPSGASWSGPAKGVYSEGGESMLSLQVDEEAGHVCDSAHLGARNEFGEWVPGVPVETEVRCASQPDTGKA